MVTSHIEVPRRERAPVPEELGGLRDLDYIVPSGRRLTEYEAVTCYTQPQQGGGGLQHAGEMVLRPDGRAIFDSQSTSLRCDDWFAFRDPNQLWQRGYYVMQSRSENAIDIATEVAAFSGGLMRLDSHWLEEGLIGAFLPFGHVEYGLFRTLNCAARESLSDTLNSVLVFNAADKLRHAQAIAILGFDLEQALPGFSPGRGRQLWLEGELWQPVRRLVEQVMAIVDWAEAVVAVNGAIEPLVCEPLRRLVFAWAASRYADPVTPVVASTATKDWRRNSRWTRSFLDFVVNAPGGQDNGRLVTEWTAQWTERAGPVGTELLAGIEERLGLSGLMKESLEVARSEQERVVGPSGGVRSSG